MESPAGLFGALEVAQRQYDLCCEVENYLKEHPKAAVVNLGCGYKCEVEHLNKEKAALIR